MTVHEVPPACPVCAGPLLAVRLECRDCEVALEGRFKLLGLLGLGAEQLDFVEVFVRNRGVIRDVEAELGISYPTVRARLDEVVAAMTTARQARPAVAGDLRRQILERLERGEIDAGEAIAKLGDA